MITLIVIGVAVIIFIGWILFEIGYHIGYTDGWEGHWLFQAKKKYAKPPIHNET